MLNRLATQYAYKWFCKALLAGVLFLSLMAGCGGGGGGSSSGGSSGGSTSNTTTMPEKTISEFSSAVKSSNVSEALESVTLDSKDRIRFLLENLDDDSRQRLANALSNATVVSQTESLIIFTTTITNPDGNTIECTFELTLGNGVWKLSGL